MSGCAYAPGAAGPRGRFVRAAALALAWIVAVDAAAGQVEPAAACPAGVALSYVANEGVLLRSAAGAVLVDALFREGVAPYPVPDAEQRRRLESARPPFDAVDWVLATHRHADHFDAASVAAHLRANPRARFVSTAEAVEAVRHELGTDSSAVARTRAVAPAEGASETVADGALRIEALALHHGRDRGVANLGFLIRSNGVTLLHVGDSEATAEDLAPLELPGRGIDVALLPTWYLFSATWRAALPAIAPASIGVIHFPGRDHERGFVARHGGWPGVFAYLEAHQPPAFAFAHEPAERCIRAGR